MTASLRKLAEQIEKWFKMQPDCTHLKPAHAHKLAEFLKQTASHLQPQAPSERWISVGEYLPDPNWYGLICTSERHIEEAYFRRDPIGPLELKTCWHLTHTDSYGDLIELDLQQVTHWRPLPALPPIDDKTNPYEYCVICGNHVTVGCDGHDFDHGLAESASRPEGEK